jgi:exodeoxyribonuclease V alpha subunit
MASRLTEICAVPLEEKYRRESFAITKARQGMPVNQQLPRQFSLLGDAAPGEMKPQLPYRFWGRWESNQFGDAFRFDSFAPAQPHGHAGVVKYLQQARHVGIAFAELLWDEFGGDAVRVLREEPEKASEAIGPKFPIEKAREAAEDLKTLQAAENLTIQLYDLFDGRGFGKACVRQALKLWGAEAVDVLTRDPYRAMALRGVGFLKADKFYLDLGKQPQRLKRQAYCLTYAVTKESDQAGHVWVQWEQGIEYLKAAVAGSDVSPDKALTLARRGGLLMTRQDSDGRVWAADVSRAAAEDYVCRHLVDAMATEVIEWPSLDRPEFAELTDHQREQLQSALTGPVAVLGGRPGTGKSFTLVRLVRAILAQHGQCVAVMAPTGKAAQRVKELMTEAKLSGVKPTTIHSGLGVASCDEGGWRFQHDERNPLKCRFLIVEESSMCGTGLLKSLLAARARGCGVLFVGDVNQLPPVEYGAPLRDLIAAGLPYGELKEIHRNAGTIVRVCSAICDGQPWQPDDQIDLQAEGGPKNLMLIPASKATAPTVVCHLLESLRDSSPYDAIWDVQVLVAVNDRSTLSRKLLNKQLQELLNPQAGDKRTPFRVGDKVIQLRNAFIPLAVQRPTKGWTSAEEKTLVANGEIGRVLHAEEKKTIVQFPSSDKPVIVFRGSRKSDSEEDDTGPETKGEHAKANGKQDPQKDDARTDTGCDLDLAYAVTTFKAQGSQFPIVITCLDEYPGASGEFGVCGREWVYTSVSRSQKAAFLVGMKHVADGMCRRPFINRRKTWMVETIRELAAKAGVRLSIREADLW